VIRILAAQVRRGSSGAENIFSCPRIYLFARRPNHFTLYTDCICFAAHASGADGQDQSDGASRVTLVTTRNNKTPDAHGGTGLQKGLREPLCVQGIVTMSDVKSEQASGSVFQGADERLQDWIRARRNELLAQWAGHLLGKTGAALSDYARQIVAFRNTFSGDNVVVRRIAEDLVSIGHRIDSAIVRAQLTRFQKQAWRECYTLAAA